MKRFFLLALITSVVLPTYSDSRFKQRFLGCYESFCQVEIKKNNPKEKEIKKNSQKEK